MKIETTLDDMKRSTYGDWPYVFAYADGTESSPETIPGESADTAAFGLHHVSEILGSVEGENAGPEWVAVWRLKDGRFFAVKAGCDYTGWG